MFGGAELLAVTGFLDARCLSLMPLSEFTLWWWADVEHILRPYWLWKACFSASFLYFPLCEDLLGHSTKNFSVGLTVATTNDSIRLLLQQTNINIITIYSGFMFASGSWDVEGTQGNTGRTCRLHPERPRQPNRQLDYVSDCEQLTAPLCRGEELWCSHGDTGPQTSLQSDLMRQQWVKVLHSVTSPSGGHTDGKIFCGTRWQVISPLRMSHTHAHYLSKVWTQLLI